MSQVYGRGLQVAREAEPWVRLAARLGILAKGVVYAAIGLLALLAATGRGGGAADQKDAVNLLSDLPFGRAIVGVVAIGLLGYALWGMLQAVRNPEGDKPTGRIAHAFSAIVYGALGFAALGAAMGDRASGSPQGTASNVLNAPGGQPLLILAGVAVLGMGVASLVKAWTKSFMKRLRTESMDGKERDVAQTAGRLGYAARGVVFLLTGLFVARAGLTADSNQAGGIEEALRTLARSPFGPWLLGAVALGLLAYAAYMVIEAKYRRMAPVA